MPAQTLDQRYPWYHSHKMAVDTIVACLQIDVETVLANLDKKIRPLQNEAKPDSAKAA